MLPMHEEKAILIRMDDTKPLHECREVWYEERKPRNSPLSIGPKNSSIDQPANAKYPPMQKRSRAKPRCDSCIEQDGGHIIDSVLCMKTPVSSSSRSRVEAIPSSKFSGGVLSSCLGALQLLELGRLPSCTVAERDRYSHCTPSIGDTLATTCHETWPPRCRTEYSSMSNLG